MIFSETFGDAYRNKVELRADGKGMLLCNYRIELTRSEYELVSLLLDSEGWMKREGLAQKLNSKVSSIPVHIANVNKKACSVCGEKLIEGNRQGEYRIAEYM